MMKKIKALRNKKGFTLIELLTVIAILGILVLIAAPKFLGYTAQANVATMKADVKALSTSALVYSADQEIEGVTDAWPVDATDTTGKELDFDGDGVKETGYKLDKTKLKHIKTTKNDIGEYYLVTEGDDAGSVFHFEGVKDKDGHKQHGVKTLKYDENGVLVTTTTPVTTP